MNIFCLKYILQNSNLNVSHIVEKLKDHKQKEIERVINSENENICSLNFNDIYHVIFIVNKSLI